MSPAKEPETAGVSTYSRGTSAVKNNAALKIKFLAQPVVDLGRTLREVFQVHGAVHHVDIDAVNHFDLLAALQERPGLKNLRFDDLAPTVYFRIGEIDWLLVRRERSNSNTPGVARTVERLACSKRANR
jgi:hypothetical protein